MAAKLEKVRHPGIYKRGSRYVVIFRDADARQRQASARTLDEARKVRAARQADVARGEFHRASREKFRDYAEAWVERYQGTGRKGFRESTRDDYRRLLTEFAYPYFRNRRLTEITPSDIAGFIGWLCDEAEQGRALSDSTVRNIINPVRSCFATAVREGKVRHNPTTGAALPHRERVEDEDGEEVRALTRDQLATFLAAMTLANLPDSQVRRTLLRVGQPYLNATGLDQNNQSVGAKQEGGSSGTEEGGGVEAQQDGVCNPNYEGECLDQPGDYDCPQSEGNGPNFTQGEVHVVGEDEYGLDRDGDGIGCEDQEGGRSGRSFDGRGDDDSTPRGGVDSDLAGARRSTFPEETALCRLPS